MGKEEDNSAEEVVHQPPRQTVGDGRSSVARGYLVASQITSIAFQMIIPVGLGWYVDEKTGLSPLFILAGVALGFFVAMLSLMQLVRR